MPFRLGLAWVSLEEDLANGLSDDARVGYIDTTGNLIWQSDTAASTRLQR